ncbi:TPA: hypothetical protein ACH3X2_007407 [Trebouxia sp. C0005]
MGSLLHITCSQAADDQEYDLVGGLLLGRFHCTAGRSALKQSSSCRAIHVQRTMRLAFYGGCIAGPIGHNWFNFLDKMVFPKAATSAKAIASKILLDQMIMAPIGTCLFYIVTSVLQGETQQVPSKLKEKFIPTLIASYTLWPAAHAINFKFVPSSQRILYTNIVSILWTYILSQAAAATVSAHQPVVKGEEPEPLTIPQQVAVFLTEEEQVAAMQLVVEELASTPVTEDTEAASPKEPAPA